MRTKLGVVIAQYDKYELQAEKIVPEGQLSNHDKVECPKDQKSHTLG